MEDTQPQPQKPKIKKIHLISIAIFIVAAIGVRLWQLRVPETTIELKGQSLRVMVADTPARQFRGLGGRESLAPYDGMLFIMGEPKRYGFVMRDVKFPIDIIWLDHGIVVDIAKNVPIEPGVPEFELKGYYPRETATVVLELNAGWADAHGLVIGDALTGVSDAVEEGA